MADSAVWASIFWETLFLHSGIRPAPTGFGSEPISSGITHDAGCFVLFNQVFIWPADVQRGIYPAPQRERIAFRNLSAKLSFPERCMVPFGAAYLSEQ
jgi:hypothetical protein